MSVALHNKYLKLTKDLKSLERVLVAFSGGCDSTLLLAIARRVLGQKNVLAVTAVSASLPTREKENTARLVQPKLCVKSFQSLFFLQERTL
jgi:uncharacterized protein